MSREAIKLALEHAKRDERHLNHAETRYWCRMYRDIAEKAVEELAKPDFWEGYVPEPVKPAQPQVRTGNCLRVGVCASEGHKIQAQRTWVSLTDEEISQLWMGTSPYFNDDDFARAIEAKLRSKNEDRN